MDFSLATFAAPPREFSVLPFWFWNDELDAEEIRSSGCTLFFPFHDPNIGTHHNRKVRPPLNFNRLPIPT